MRDQTKILAAMARLKNNPDFQVFREFTLEGALKHETELCTLRDNPAKHQGAVSVLKKILEDLDTAQQAYHDLKGREVPLAAETSF